MKLSLIFIVLISGFGLFNGMVWAQGTQPTVPVVVQPDSTTSTIVTSRVVTVLEKTDSAIPKTIPLWLLGSLGVVVEFLVRAVPSAKPRSFLIVVGKCFSLLSVGFMKLSDLADLVIQNIKDPTPPTV